MNKYWYAYRLRGFSIGCQPSDFIDHNDNHGRLGTVAYGRRLTAKEMNHYSLDAIGVDLNEPTQQRTTIL